MVLLNMREPQPQWTGPFYDILNEVHIFFLLEIEQFRKIPLLGKSWNLEKSVILEIKNLETFVILEVENLEEFIALKIERDI